MIDGLAGALGDVNPEVRNLAVDLLVQRSEDHAVPFLVALGDDPDELVRAHCQLLIARPWPPLPPRPQFN